MPDTDEQYVYIHRDENGDPVYIGRGRRALRAVGHEKDAIDNFRADNSCSVEIAGPFGEQHIAAEVEAALISAFTGTPKVAAKLVNKVAGVSRGNFRPLGVPDKMATKILEPAIDRAALLKATGRCAALFVLVKDHTTSDGRIGYNLASVPADRDIKSRVIQWWQLGKRIEEWRSRPESIPSLLIGLSGPIKHRIIIASLQIDRDPTLSNWVKHQERKLYRVPVTSDPDNEFLNYGNLRGRRIAAKVTKFGGVKSKFFDIVQ